jgi:hypothetical protein
MLVKISKHPFLKNKIMKKLTEILSAARNDFLKNGDTETNNMKEVESLFKMLALRKFDSEFLWSEYNRDSWKYYVSDNYGPEGGIAIFSLEESETNYKNEGTDNFKAIALVKPLGEYPYSLFFLGNHRDSKLIQAVLLESNISSSVIA